MIRANVAGIELRFETAPSLFSPMRPDRGSLAMYFVTKRKTWYQNKLRTIFGGARVHEMDSYFVFEAVKKSSTYANRAQSIGRSPN
jgi:16S rRNA G1207 methylase RsmC